MNIEKLIIKHFKNITKIETNFKDINFLVGGNGAGKTSLIDAIEILFNGKGSVPKNNPDGSVNFDQLIQKDEDKAEIIGYFQTEGRKLILSRRITSKGAYLTIKTSDGPVPSEKEIKNFFNEFTFSPIAFANKTAKEQAVAFGIDTTLFDTKIAEKEHERTAIGQDRKRIQGAYESGLNLEPVEKVSAQGLMEKRDEIVNFNNEQNQKQVIIEKLKEEQIKTDEELEKLYKMVSELESKQIMLREQVYKSSKPEPMKSTYEIIEQIKNSDKTNNQAIVYENHLKNKTEFEESDNKYKNHTTLIDNIKTEKLDFIKNSGLPFSSMSIDDFGGLLIRGRPFNSKNWSTGEIWNMSTKIISVLNPKLKMIFVSQADLIDDDNLAYIKKLADDGFQLVFEVVRPLGNENNCIYFKESKIVG